MDKATAKVNQNEFDRYENLFNTAYVVSQKRPVHYSTHINGLHLGSDLLCRGTLLKQYLKCYAITQ